MAQALFRSLLPTISFPFSLSYNHVPPPLPRQRRRIPPKNLLCTDSAGQRHASKKTPSTARKSLPVDGVFSYLSMFIERPCVKTMKFTET